MGNGIFGPSLKDILAEAKKVAGPSFEAEIQRLWDEWRGTADLFDILDILKRRVEAKNRELVEFRQRTAPCGEPRKPLLPVGGKSSC